MSVVQCLNGLLDALLSISNKCQLSLVLLSTSRCILEQVLDLRDRAIHPRLSLFTNAA